MDKHHRATRRHHNRAKLTVPNGHILCALQQLVDDTWHLRTHGGTSETKVPFILNRPLNDAYKAKAASRKGGAQGKAR